MDPRGRPAVKWKSGWEEKIWEWPKNCYFSIGILSKSRKFWGKNISSALFAELLTMGMKIAIAVSGGTTTPRKEWYLLPQHPRHIWDDG